MAVKNITDLHVLGDVGIGTTSPASRLHVTGTGSGTFRAESTSSDYPIRISGHQTTADAYIGVDQSNKLKFYVNSADRMVINSSGNVGIGTTAPANTLDVNGVANFAGGTVGGVIDTHNAGIYLSTQGRGLSGNFQGYARNLISSIGSGIIEIGQGTSLISNIRLYAGSSSANGIITFFTNGAEKMRLTQDGNLGIGTTSPSEKVEIYGDATYYSVKNTSGNVAARLGTDSSGDGNFELFQSADANNRKIKLYAETNAANYINNGGNFGIGTTSPSYKLDVAGTTRSGSRLTLDSAFYRDHIAVTRGSKGYYLTQSGDTALLEAIGTTDRFDVFGTLQVKTNGNVGIGTTSPAYKLDIAGDVFTNTKYVSDTGELLSLYESSWNVGNRDHYIIYNGWRSNTGDYLMMKGAGNQSSLNGAVIVSDGNNGRTYFGRHANQSPANDNAITPLDETYAFIGATATYFSSNVGIGTTSPGQKLDVSGNVQGNNIYANDSSVPSLYMERGDGTPQPVIRLVKSNDNLLIGHTAIDEVIFYDDAGEAMRLNGTGNLGIGTTSPAVKLDVSGQGAFSRNYVYGQSNYHIALNEDSGAGYIGNVNGSPYIANASYYGSQIYNVSASQTGLASVYVQSTGDILFLTNTFTAGASSIQTANQRMVVKGNGNVGIATTNPTSTLHLYGDNSKGWERHLYLDYNGTDIAAIVTDADGLKFRNMTGGNNFYFRTSGNATSLFVNDSGNVGIGETSVDARLHITTSSAGLVNQKFESAGSAAWRIGVPASSTSFVFDNANDNLSSAKLSIDASGNLTAAGDVTAYSDARLKENVETLPNALESVKAMRGVTYNKIGEEKQSIGVIAQEVQAVLPQLVAEDEEGTLSVAYGNITAVLIEAIKEQQEQIDELKAIINGLTK